MDELPMVRSLNDIPANMSDEEEVRFWETHTLSEELWDSLPKVSDDELPIPRGYVRCVNNDGYPVDLTLGKLYKVLPEHKAEPESIRVVDNSGEDYLFKSERFVPNIQAAGRVSKEEQC